MRDKLESDWKNRADEGGKSAGLAEKMSSVRDQSKGMPRKGKKLVARSVGKVGTM